MLRKKARIYRALILLQDSYAEKYPMNTDLQQKAFGIVARRFNVSEKEVRLLVMEMIRAGKKMPKLKKR